MFREIKNSTQKMVKRYPDLFVKFANWEKKLKKRSMKMEKFVKFVKKEEKVSLEEAEYLTNCFLDDGNVNCTADEIYYRDYKNA